MTALVAEHENQVADDEFDQLLALGSGMFLKRGLLVRMRAASVTRRERSYFDAGSPA